MKTPKEIKKYCKLVAKKFFAKYTTQYEIAAGNESADGKYYIVYFYHTIMEDNIGVYLDENNELQIYNPTIKQGAGYGGEVVPSR